MMTMASHSLCHIVLVRNKSRVCLHWIGGGLPKGVTHCTSPSSVSATLSQPQLRILSWQRQGAWRRPRKLGVFALCSDLGIANTQALAPQRVPKLPSLLHYMGVVRNQGLHVPMSRENESGCLPHPLIDRVISHGGLCVCSVSVSTLATGHKAG